MSFQRPIIYCAFSNDAEYTLRLFEEEGRISSVLTELNRQGKIEYQHKDKASLDNVYDFFNDYHNRIYIFHYGGHSDSEFLHLQVHSAHSKDLATLIGQQKHLKLVFLNGCANQAQVRDLLHKGVPAVIATRESVGDNQAIILAEQFYKAFASGKTLQQSFEVAESYLRQKHADRELVRERGCRPREESPDRPFPWGLYYENEAVLDWHIGLVEQESKIEILTRLREASRQRHQKFTSPGGRFQHLDIQEAILAGIRDVAPNRSVRFEENVDLDGERLPLLESVSSLWESHNPHSLVVGAGGMGKTVSLLRLWERWSSDGEDTPVPIFIQLNEFNNNPERDFIQNYIRLHYANLDLDEVLKTPAIGQGGKLQPHILLLLDGFNEVTASSNELILEINRLRVQEDYPGIQMVFSSRVDIRSTCQWQSFHLLELQPLSDAQIQAYLRKNVPSDSRLIEVLRNPMMLSIYATQSELPKRYLEKGLLKEQITSTGEMLFNVEAIQRIKIEEQFSIQPGALLLHRFVLEHLLPFLGWTMQQAGSFSMKETGLLQFLGEAPEHLLPKDFFLVFKDFRKMDREALNGKEAWELQEELIDQICCRGLTMLVSENNSYRFLHQNFRDYFAARYLQNQIRLALHQKILPEALRQAPLDFYVRQMLGELESEHYNKIIYVDHDNRWSIAHNSNNGLLILLLGQCRDIFDDDHLGYTIWNILTLLTQLRGELIGLNLSRLNLNRFHFNSICCSKQTFSSKFTEAVINEKNLLFTGHLDKVNKACFSPNGKYFATASYDKTAKIWDAYTGQCIMTLNGHLEVVNSVAYNYLGDYLITCSDDKTAKVWSTQTGECLVTLKGHLATVSSASFSPNGKNIITVSLDKTIKIWNTETGEHLFSCQGHSGRIVDVAFNSIGSHFATASYDKTAKIWDANTWNCILTLYGHSSWVQSIAFSPDNKYIITGSSDKTARIWEAQTGECILLISGHSEILSSVTFNPIGSRVLTCSYDGTAKVWDSLTGKCLFNIDGHSSFVMSANYSYDGKRILTSSDDESVKIWDAESGNCLLKLDDHALLGESVSCDPQGRVVIIGSHDKTAKIWDIKTSKCILVLRGHSSWVMDAKYNPRGDLIVTCSVDKTAKVWDASTGKCLLTLHGHTDQVYSAVFRDNNYILTASFDKTARVWELKTGQCVLVLRGHLEGINSAKYSSNGKRIVTSSLDNTAKIWDSETGECLLTLFGHNEILTDAVFCPKGKNILTGSVDGKAKVWDAETGEALFTLHGHSYSISSCVYNSEGTLILTSSRDKTIRIWDAETGECLSIFRHFSEISSAIFSPTGNHIVAVFKDGKTKIFNTQSGECYLTFNSHPGLYLQGCDFRNLHPDSNLSPESIALLRQYGAIFNDDDAQNWADLMEKHFGIKPN